MLGTLFIYGQPIPIQSFTLTFGPVAPPPPARIPTTTSGTFTAKITYFNADLFASLLPRPTPLDIVLAELEARRWAAYLLRQTGHRMRLADLVRGVERN